MYASNPTLLNGIRVRITLSAVSIESAWEIRKHPADKRRRRWAAVQVEITKPACYRTAQGLIIHPTLWAQLAKDLGSAVPP